MWLILIKCEQLIIALTIMLISHEIGKRMFKLFHIEVFNELEKIVFFMGLGLGCIIYIMFFSGLLRLYYSWIFKTLFCSFSLIILMHFYSNRRKIKDLLCNILCRINIKSAFFTYTLLILVGVIIYMLITSLLPEIFGDALRYHLYIPKLYIQNHRIYNVDIMAFSNLPFNIEMLYTLGLLLNGQIVAKLINFLLIISTVLLIYSFCRRYFNFKIGIMSSLIFCTTPVVNFSSITAGSDIGISFFSFLGIYSICLWMGYKRSIFLLLGAIFCGFALGSKYSALYVIVPSIFFIAMNSGLSKKRLVKNIVTFLLIILIITSIWWIKSYVYTGNPVFPHLNRIFKSKFWWQEFNDWHNFASYGKGVNLKNILKIPLEIALGRYRDVYNGSVGLFYILFIPMALYFYICNKKKSTIVKHLLIYIGIYFSLWLITVQNVRFLMPMLTISCIVTAFGIYNLDLLLSPEIRRLFKILLIVSFIVAGPFLNMNMFKGSMKLGLYNPLSNFFKDEKKYLTEKLSDYPIAQYVNTHLKKTDRILEIKVQENYYYYDCDMIRLYEYPFVRITWEHISDTELSELTVNLERKNIGYILVNLDDWCVKEAMSSQQSPLTRIAKQELYSYKSYKLYKIDYNSLY